MHNASTVDFDELQSTDDKGEKIGGEWDDCPAYPSDLNTTQRLLLANHQLSGPSLHLTFGIEQGCAGTMESLLHHAIHAYFAEGVSKDSDYQQLIVPASEGATWKSLLHHSLAEVARRRHDECDNPRVENTRMCDGSALLRRSVPLLLLNNTGINAMNGEEKNQYATLKLSYLKALDTFESTSNLAQTLSFVQTHREQSTDDADLSFCFPGYTLQENKLVDVLSQSEAMTTNHAKMVEGFVRYANADDSFEEAMQRMNKHGMILREKDWTRQDHDLEVVGQ